MAGSTIVEVKRSIVDYLDGVLVDWAVGYAWPGDLSATDRTVWLGGASTGVETTSMRSDRRPRTETVDLTVSFWATESDAASDSDARQETADADTVTALRHLDEWIADDNHLGRADLVNRVWLISWTHDVGPTGSGDASLITAVVRYEARLL